MSNTISPVRPGAGLYVTTYLPTRIGMVAVERSHDCPFRFPEREESDRALSALRMDSAGRVSCACQRCYEISSDVAREVMGI